MSKLISLCMIVKNEEDVLDRCLNSVKDIMDEIIIVDTGSTDSTKDIAYRYTDKVFDYEWVDDFAAARNQSIQHATGKWIFVMDADEYMEAHDAKLLRDFLSKETPSEDRVYSVSILSFLGQEKSYSVNEGLVIRAFPNHCHLQYARPIHEQVVSTKKIELKSINMPCRVFHSGYTQETISNKNKHERNLSIFNKMKNQSRLSAYDNLMLGNQQVMMGNYEEGLEYLQLALSKKRELGTAYKQVLFTMMNVYMNTNKLIEAWNFMDEHLVDYEKNYPDILALRGIIYYHLGFTQDAKITLLTCVENAELLAAQNKPISISSPDLGVRLPLKYLALICEQEKDLSSSVYFLTKYLRVFNDGDALTRMVRILALKDNAKQISGFLDHLLSHMKDELRAPLLCKISISLGLRDLADHYYQQLSATEVLSLADQLRYALLMNQEEDFKQIWFTGLPSEQEDPASLNHLALAALVWNKPEWIQWSNNNKEETSYLQAIEGLLLGDSSGLIKNEGYLFTLLGGLYTTNYLDMFDKILDQVESPAVINRLANMLYTIHHDDAALQCYSYLDANNALEYSSCCNLASHHINLKNTDQALRYLELAIKQDPSQKQLFIQFCLLSKDPAEKRIKKEQLIQLDSNYINLPPFIAL